MEQKFSHVNVELQRLGVGPDKTFHPWKAQLNYLADMHRKTYGLTHYGLDMLATSVSYPFFKKQFVSRTQWDSLWSNLWLWERSIGICCRWDVPPSAVFILTRLVRLCGTCHLDEWACMYLVRGNMNFDGFTLLPNPFQWNIQSTIAWVQEKQSIYRFSFLSILDGVMFHSMRIRALECQRECHMIRQERECRLQCTIVAHWQQVIQHKYQWISYYILKWKQMVQQSKKARLECAIKTSILAKWVQMTNDTRKKQQYQRRVWDQWKRFVSQSHIQFIQGTVNHIITLGITLALERTHVTQSVSETRKMLLCRRYARKWVRITKAHPPFEHLLVMRLLLDKYKVHMIISMLIPCFLHLAQHIPMSSFNVALTSYSKKMVVCCDCALPLPSLPIDLLESLRQHVGCYLVVRMTKILQVTCQCAPSILELMVDLQVTLTRLIHNWKLLSLRILPSLLRQKEGMAWNLSQRVILPTLVVMMWQASTKSSSCFGTMSPKETTKVTQEWIRGSRCCTTTPQPFRPLQLFLSDFVTRNVFNPAFLMDSTLSPSRGSIMNGVVDDTGRVVGLTLSAVITNNTATGTTTTTTSTVTAATTTTTSNIVTYSGNTQ